ncbi:MAG: Uncharacterized protein CEN91_373 [Candidatus Berkelbacteria bacterium Licking1014_85]|uniref:Uncharacterized protein n=1 Tax=Candidatus Berkelbacteria bacterium Licking1014_85 TaxID=2017148 RepID=A0A554LIR1_9BACT|nr:MAG: Uncharacterized protein CEN91_373 [Candidatus Berkelbacteria bacterium Licking1014_85]
MKFKFYLYLLIIGILTFRGSVFAIGSSSYQIPQFQLPNFGGSSSSSNYKLESASGPMVGVSSSSSYGLDMGFPSVTGGTISISLDSNSVNIGQLTPGTPISGQTSATVATDALAGYNLAIEKNQLITHTDLSTTVADVSATIASPAPWSGTGFGFTVSSGTSLEAKWGSGSNYALIPTQTATTAHSVVQAITAPDATVVSYKLDTSVAQKSGSYSTLVSFVATALP